MAVIRKRKENFFNDRFGVKSTRINMKYYSQYHNHELFELQESLSGLSKSNRWVMLADNLPWDCFMRARDMIFFYLY